MPPDPLLEVLVAGGRKSDRLTHVRHLPARTAEYADWPSWADSTVVAGYRELGITRPWVHQVEAANATWAGMNVAVASSTGSGKSLAFWLPALSAIRADVAHRVLDPGRIESVGARRSVLYIAPTKALAADQLVGLQRVVDAAGSHIRVATCDGDTGYEERRWAQDHADIVLTNPDFLHFALLPGHRRWTRFLQGLLLVVIDEGHAYRGVFGAHVALVLRRLRRLVRHLEGPRSPATVEPASIGIRAPEVLRPGLRFVVASATSAEPGEAAARLIGVAPTEVVTVSTDGSPAGQRTFALWQPPAVTAFKEVASGYASGLLVDPSEPADRRSWADPFYLTASNTENNSEGDLNGTPFPARPGLPADPGHRERPDDPAIPADGGDRPRRTATAEVADLLADLVAAGARTLAFTRSRRGAESVAAMTRDHLRPIAATLPGAVAAYRGGYLPEERRELEAALREGRIRAMATTNALELGVDISGLDAVLIAGWPGTRASLWQQAGRAGRAGAQGLVVFVAREDPLDTYLVQHPEAIFEAPVESTVFDPANPYVLAPHLCATAAEIPLRSSDLQLFGDPEEVMSLIETLVGNGTLRRRPSGWYWTHSRPASMLTDLRGSGAAPVVVVESATGRLLGTVDASAADATVHDGAVYVHQGSSYVVDELNLADGVALVHPDDVDYGTWSQAVTSIAVTADDPGSAVSTQRWGPVSWCFGSVNVSSQVVSFQRRRLPDMQILGLEPLDLPERGLPTKAVWWSVPTEVLDSAGISPAVLPGALHAAEHASIGLLPLLATCDRWDLGGVSTALHVDTAQATVFVYDAYPGGAGFAERGFRLGPYWLRATLEAISHCPCTSGCPGCIQSPKCGNDNSPLDKTAAVLLLDAVLRHAPR